MREHAASAASTTRWLDQTCEMQKRISSLLSSIVRVLPLEVNWQSFEQKESHWCSLDDRISRHVFIGSEWEASTWSISTNAWCPTHVDTYRSMPTPRRNLFSPKHFFNRRLFLFSLFLYLLVDRHYIADKEGKMRHDNTIFSPSALSLLLLFDWDSFAFHSFSSLFYFFLL